MAAGPTERFDAAIAGGGVVGLATALALATAPGPKARVLVCDPAFSAPPLPRSLRAVALTPASRDFLDRLGVWTVVARGAEPLTAMRLTDSRPGAVPPPTFLTFPDPDPTGEPLAHMAVQDDLRAALLAACTAAGVTLRGAAIASFDAGGSATVLDDAGRTRARLLVASDGAQSRLRDWAGLKTVGWDYGQSAIVATLSHTADHGGEAVQHFLPDGPVALLPMRDARGTRHRSSLVWTVRRTEAERLVALPPDAFAAALWAAGGLERGDLALEDRPVAYPLRLRLSRRLIATRFALAGDAARTVHPLAGQGLNLGLGDAEAIGRHVGGAMALGLDPGAALVLERYQRDRRTDQVVMAAATDALNRLFSTDSPPARLLRDLGLGVVDRSPALKRWLQRVASGA